MNYVSTRGGMTPQSFSNVLLEGLAPDGGLIVPQNIPQISADTLESWRALSYPALAAQVLGLWIDDIPAADLQRLTHAAYAPGVFAHAQTAPLTPVTPGLFLLGLSHGPTLAFKDMAMQFLGQVFEYVLQKRDVTLNILGATSGDTGSAAEYALRGKQGVSVFMLSPHGRMSDFQRAQMYTLQDANIHNIAIRGVFDDCQDIVKTLAGDVAFKAQYRLGAVNSINWARIAAQIVYYVWAWLRATNAPGQQVSFAVPSGNFGNILSGFIARRMGIPIHRLVLATNENNVLEECFRSGIYRPRSAAQTHATSSPSMDISRASNFERFVYDLLGQDAQQLRALWQALETQGEVDFSPWLTQGDHGIVAETSTHADRIHTIRDLYKNTGILVDPHTADGLKAARTWQEDGIPMIALETALPAKFNDIIREAIGQDAPVPESLRTLAQLPQRVTVLDCSVDEVRRFVQKTAVIA